MTAEAARRAILAREHLRRIRTCRPPEEAPVATCRSCGARIRWAVTPAGKRIPLDADPVDGGNVLLHEAPNPGEDPTATVVGKRVQPNLFGDDGPRYVSHFSTCPDAAAHRRR
jgi:hypothetical protein